MLRASSLGTVTLQAERSLAWLDGKYGFERFKQVYLFLLSDGQHLLPTLALLPLSIKGRVKTVGLRHTLSHFERYTPHCMLIL